MNILGLCGSLHEASLNARLMAVAGQRLEARGANFKAHDLRDVPLYIGGLADASTAERLDGFLRGFLDWAGRR